MAKELIVKVPELLKSKGLTDKDLMWGARISMNTAKRWADPVQSKSIDRIDKDTLEKIASFLDAQVSDLLEVVDKV